MLQLLHGAKATNYMHNHGPSAVQSVSEFWTLSHSKHPAKTSKLRWGCNAVRPCLCTLIQCIAASSPKLHVYAWSRLWQDSHLEHIHGIAFADQQRHAWREQFTPAATHEHLSLQIAGSHFPFARLTCPLQVQGWADSWQDVAKSCMTSSNSHDLLASRSVSITHDKQCNTCALWPHRIAFFHHMFFSFHELLLYWRISYSSASMLIPPNSHSGPAPARATNGEQMQASFTATEWESHLRQ